MRAIVPGLLLLTSVLAASATATAGNPRDPLSVEAINGAAWSAQAPGGRFSPITLKAQVQLARAGFSPGVIDARDGENYRKAIRAFQRAHKLSVSGQLDESTWNELTRTSLDDVVTETVVEKADVEGPFAKAIPRDFTQMAKLKKLDYRSARERLAEKSHMSEDLLAALNPRVDLHAAGAKIIVANVDRAADVETTGSVSRAKAAADAKGNPGGKEGVKITVNKSERSLSVFAGDGRLIAFYPASVGSPEKPAPSGSLTVRAIAENPTYRYNPDYGFKGQRAKKPVEIAPGPNNPVGSVWIALSAESYGIHGTPEPDKISKSQSHGCIRLTNWDALALAKLVRKGTAVEFIE